MKTLAKAAADLHLDMVSAIGDAESAGRITSAVARHCRCLSADIGRIAARPHMAVIPVASGADSLAADIRREIHSSHGRMQRKSFRYRDSATIANLLTALSLALYGQDSLESDFLLTTPAENAGVEASATA